MDGPNPTITSTSGSWLAAVAPPAPGNPLLSNSDSLVSVERREAPLDVVQIGRDGLTFDHHENGRQRPPSHPTASSTTQSCTPNIVRLADVQPARVQWLWPGRFALGKLSLLVGDPGLGKSFLTLDMAARVSQGMAWPDSPSEPSPAGGVVLVSAEDDLGDTIRPRLDAAGADVERINALESVTRGQGNDVPFSLPVDLPALERAIEQTPGCRLVIIDPITSFLAGVDSHRNAEVREALRPVSDLAARHGVAVVAVSHLTKSVRTRAIYRTMGSLAFTAAARAVWCVTKDPADERRRLFLPVKNNLAIDNSGLAYRLVTLDEGGTPILDSDRIPVVTWEMEPVRLSVDDALMLHRDDKGSGALATAIDWLQRALETNDGQLEAGRVKQLAQQEGISDRTLRRARESLGVETKPSGFRGAWLWTIPEAEVEPLDSTLQSWPTVPELAKSEELANSGDLGHLSAKSPL